MFDTQVTYWNFVWGFFILLGGFVFVLGMNLMIKRGTVTSRTFAMLTIVRRLSLVASRSIWEMLDGF